MLKKKYTAEFKTKVILTIIKGDREFNAICADIHTVKEAVAGAWMGRAAGQINVMLERWFRSLKTEQIYPNEYHSSKELRKLIGDYVHVYNTERPHGVLEYAALDVDAVYCEMFVA